MEKKKRIARILLNAMGDQHEHALAGDLAMDIYGMLGRDPLDEIEIIRPRRVSVYPHLSLAMQGLRDAGYKVDQPRGDTLKVTDPEGESVEVPFTSKDLEFRPVERDGMPVLAVEDMVRLKLAATLWLAGTVAEQYKQPLAQHVADLAKMHAKLGTRGIDALLATSEIPTDPDAAHRWLQHGMDDRLSATDLTNVGADEAAVRAACLTISEGLSLTVKTWEAAKQRESVINAEGYARDAEERAERMRNSSLAAWVVNWVLEQPSMAELERIARERRAIAEHERRQEENGTWDTGGLDQLPSLAARFGSTRSVGEGVLRERPEPYTRFEQAWKDVSAIVRDNVPTADHLPTYNRSSQLSEPELAQRGTPPTYQPPPPSYNDATSVADAAGSRSTAAPENPEQASPALGAAGTPPTPALSGPPRPQGQARG